MEIEFKNGSEIEAINNEAPVRGLRAQINPFLDEDIETLKMLFRGEFNGES